MAPAPDVFIPQTLDELQRFSGRGYSQSVGFRLCGELAGGHLSGREPRKSTSGVTERWQERPGQQGVSRRFALESSGEPGHALTRTSRDPRLFWGTVSRQEAGTCEKGIDQSEAKQSIRSDRAWPIARTQARGRDSTWYLMRCPYQLTKSGSQ